MKNWKKLSSEYVFRSRWMSLRKDAYKTPKKETIPDFYIVERPDFVVIVPQTKKGKLILVQQYRHGVEKLLLNFPMGYINPKEKPKNAALRELSEETGLVVQDVRLLGSFFLSPPFMKTKGYIFSAVNISVPSENSKVSSMKFDKQEIKKVISLSQPEIEKRIHSGEICDFTSVCSYLLFKKKPLM